MVLKFTRLLVAVLFLTLTGCPEDQIGLVTASHSAFGGLLCQDKSRLYCTQARQEIGRYEHKDDQFVIDEIGSGCENRDLSGVGEFIRAYDDYFDCWEAVDDCVDRGDCPEGVVGEVERPADSCWVEDPIGTSDKYVPPGGTCGALTYLYTCDEGAVLCEEIDPSFVCIQNEDTAFCGEPDEISPQNNSTEPNATTNGSNGCDESGAVGSLGFWTACSEREWRISVLEGGMCFDGARLILRVDGEATAEDTCTGSIEQTWDGDETFLRLATETYEITRVDEIDGELWELELVGDSIRMELTSR